MMGIMRTGDHARLTINMTCFTPLVSYRIDLRFMKQHFCHWPGTGPLNPAVDVKCFLGTSRGIDSDVFMRIRFEGKTASPVVYGFKPIGTVDYTCPIGQLFDNMQNPVVTDDAGLFVGIDGKPLIIAYVRWQEGGMVVLDKTYNPQVVWLELRSEKVEG